LNAADLNIALPGRELSQVRATYSFSTGATLGMPTIAADHRW